MSGLLAHPRLRAILDVPAFFRAFRFLLVGHQTETRRRLRVHLGARPGERVLDVCCGIGEFACEVDADYVGIDINPRFIAAAARRHVADPRKTFRTMDALHMEYPDHYFDRTIFINGLHHFSDDDGRRLLKEIRRVTRVRVVIIDADGTPRGLLRRALLAADRGAWMRTPEALGELIASVLSVHAAVRFDVGLYTEMLYESRLR
ncbi:MAG TPA: class I SAM-dependent methyltransferase [Methylomirabilota bacterium]|nr:class I SAM-dependent methyltransferase [Methylomirabilota bacterium]